eukprot:4119866-Karenia_brevis.AAC.1
MRERLDDIAEYQEVFFVKDIVKYDSCLDMGFTNLDDVKYNMTINVLKEKYYKHSKTWVQECQRVAPQYQKLWIGGEEAEDGRTLSDYNIQKHPFVFMDIQNTDMQIFVKTLTVGTVTVDTDALCTVLEFRKSLGRKIDDLFTGFA